MIKYIIFALFFLSTANGQTMQTATFDEVVELACMRANCVELSDDFLRIADHTGNTVAITRNDIREFQAYAREMNLIDVGSYSNVFSSTKPLTRKDVLEIRKVAGAMGVGACSLGNSACGAATVMSLSIPPLAAAFALCTAATAICAKEYEKQMADAEAELKLIEESEAQSLAWAKERGAGGGVGEMPPEHPRSDIHPGSRVKCVTKWTAVTSTIGGKQQTSMSPFQDCK